MSRPLRIEFAGALYHVTARGDARGAIFLDDGDRDAFCAGLARVAERFEWRVWAYCLMGNHYHLLVETLQPTLSREGNNGSITVPGSLPAKRARSAVTIETTAIVCGHVFRSERPVKVLIHHSDGVWQLVCGCNDHPKDFSDFETVGLEHLLARQRDLKNQLDLAPGWIAESDERNEWSRSPLKEIE